MNVFLSADSGHLQSHLREEPDGSLSTHLGRFLVGSERQQRLPDHVHKYKRSSVGFCLFAVFYFIIICLFLFSCYKN